jgi:hypothetical protein
MIPNHEDRELANQEDLFKHKIISFSRIEQIKEIKLRSEVINPNSIFNLQVKDQITHQKEKLLTIKK